MVFIIPKGLNTKQALMYNALMRCKEANMTKKWHYNPRQFLIGCKKTNPRTGEVKVTFSTESRILKPLELEFLKEIEEEEKLKTIIEAMLKLRIGELERDIEAMKARKKAQELLLIKHLKKRK